ncbi:MAG: ankyrin repeat domain-containing protein [Acidobacteriota bacterium]
MSKDPRESILDAAAAQWNVALEPEVRREILVRAPTASDKELSKQVVTIAIYAGMKGRPIDVGMVREVMLSDEEMEAHERAESGPPLFAAIADGDVGEVRRLLGQGVDLEVTSARHEDHTPLLLALAQRDTTITALLLEHGADPSNEASGPLAPIHQACDSTPCLRLLLAAGVDPNRTMEDAVTPLMLVADHDRKLPRVELLLDHGADPRPRDKHGRTALDIALDHDAEAIAARLRRALI